MLNPIKAFNYVNSTIQNITGYSFSLSHIPQNINKVALPIIALAAGYIVAVNAENLSKSQCCYDYKDCILSCMEKTIQQIDFLGAHGDCMRICIKLFPEDHEPCMNPCMACFNPV